MHQIEARFRQWIGNDIVPLHFQVGLGQSIKIPRVYVRCRDLAVRTDLIAKPTCYCSAAAAHLEAAPTRPYAELGEMAQGAWIVHFSDCGEPNFRLRPCIVEHIPALIGIHHGVIWSVWMLTLLFRSR